MGTRVSVCGEAAADPFTAIVFAGIGIRELSMAPHAAREVHLALGRVSATDAAEIAEKVMDCPSQADAARLRNDYRRLLGLP